MIRINVVAEENLREHDFAARHLDNAVALQARQIGLKRSAGCRHSHAIGKVGAVHAAGMRGDEGVDHFGWTGAESGSPLLDD